MGGGERDGAEAIGDRIRRLRRERGLTQEVLAQPDVSPSHISHIELGVRTASLGVLRQLAPKLGVSLAYLEHGVEPATAAEREIRLSNAELQLRLGDNERRDPVADVRAVLEEAERAGDVSAAVRARCVLGLAAFGRADHREAIGQLESALGSGRISPLAHPDVHATLGRCYVSSGNAPKAVELFERCLAEIVDDAPENGAAYVRFSTYLSYALADVGELERARETVALALERADDVADPYTRVRLHWSQARLAANDGDTESALADLRRAIALLELTEDTRHLARAHLLSAEILTVEGDTEQAGPHLERAALLLGPRPDAEDLYWLRVEQARRAARMGAGEEAVIYAREALQLIGDTDPAEQGSAYWALGEGLANIGDFDAAEQALERAFELLASQRLWREVAQVSRTRARLLRQLGREDEAFALLEQAGEVAASAARRGQAVK